MSKKYSVKSGHRKFLQIARNLSDLSLRTLISQRGEDPWVIFWEGNYYYCREYEDRMIMINKASRLEDIGKQSHVVWLDELGTPEAELWAPELHRVNGKWYIYFSRGKAEKHRTYVLECQTDDPQGNYVLKGKVTDPSDQWAIDATIMYYQNKHYLVWSGRENESDKTQNLYIAPMSNPWTISGNKVCISRPEYEWEKIGAPDWQPVNEGPQLLEKNGKIFLIYSASHSLTDDYCLGQLSFVGNDPLDPAAWVKKPKPVFSKSGTIYGPGHASFIEKPDGSDWIIYHAHQVSGGGWDNRALHAQPFSWHSDGLPNFGKPSAYKQIKIIDRLLKSTPFKRG